MSLTDKQARFVEEYLVDLNATQAAIRAGYSSDSAAQAGYENLRKPEIADGIAEAMAERSKRVQITADEVLRELVDVALGDVNDLVEHRVGCCRYGWGEGFRYQRTRGELVRAEAAHAKKNEEAIRKGEPTTLFDPEGGEGYHAAREPNPECPECFGDGVGRPLFKDTGRASARARRLYSGVKVTKDGMEMKLRSQDKAVELLGRHLGMWKDKVEHSGPGGGAVPTSLTVTFLKPTVLPDAG